MSEQNNTIQHTRDSRKRAIEKGLNTLLDLSLDNKTLNEFIYYQKTEIPFFPISLLLVENNTTNLEIFDMIDSDIEKTADKLTKIIATLSTADGNGFVDSLKNTTSKNLKTLFPDTYDHDTRILKAGGLRFNLSKTYSKAEIKGAIIQECFGELQGRYEQARSERNMVFKYEPTDIVTEAESMEYLSTLNRRVDVKKRFIDPMVDFARDYKAAYKGKPARARGKIDKFVKYHKAGLTEVIQSSTYINKKDGILQVSSKHKKDTSALSRLEKAVQESKYFGAVEIDQSDDIHKFTNALEQLNQIQFSIYGEEQNLAELKGRLLGNYGVAGSRVSGMYIQGSHYADTSDRRTSAVIVDAGSITKSTKVDMSSVYSFIHECGHYVDLTNMDIYKSKARSAMVNLLRSHLHFDPEIDSEKAIAYYTKPEEIIARGIEIGYLLNKHNFDPENESFESFADRVREEQFLDIENGLVPLGKPIDQFIQYSRIYFEFGPEADFKMLMNLKEYSRFYLSVDGKAPANINNFDLSRMQAPKREQYEDEETIERKKPTKKSTYIPTHVSMYNGETVHDALEFIKNHDWDNPESIDVDIPRVRYETFYNEIFRNITDVARRNQDGWLTKGSVSLDDKTFFEQKKVMEVMYQWAKDQKDTPDEHYINYSALKAHLENAQSIYSPQMRLKAQEHFKKPIDIKANSFKSFASKEVDSFVDWINNKQVFHFDDVLGSDAQKVNAIQGRHTAINVDLRTAKTKLRQAELSIERYQRFEDKVAEIEDAKNEVSTLTSEIEKLEKAMEHTRDEFTIARNHLFIKANREFSRSFPSMFNFNNHGQIGVGAYKHDQSDRKRWYKHNSGTSKPTILNEIGASHLTQYSTNFITYLVETSDLESLQKMMSYYSFEKTDPSFTRLVYAANNGDFKAITFNPEKKAQLMKTINDMGYINGFTDELTSALKTLPPEQSIDTPIYEASKYNNNRHITRKIGTKAPYSVSNIVLNINPKENIVNCPEEAIELIKSKQNPESETFKFLVELHENAQTHKQNLMDEIRSRVENGPIIHQQENEPQKQKEIDIEVKKSPTLTDKKDSDKDDQLTISEGLDGFLTKLLNEESEKKPLATKVNKSEGTASPDEPKQPEKPKSPDNPAVNEIKKQEETKKVITKKDQMGFGF